MKMRQVIAIGGGGFGRTQESNLIEQFILDQTSKKNPKICFIPTATGDLDPYVVNYYSVFSKLNCEATHISFFKRTIDLEEHVLKQDAIFVGGGNTKSMLAVWKDWGLDNLLQKAYEAGVVMSGVSAGANCWCERAVVDSWEDELKIIDCMGFVKGNFCPHYDEEPQRRPSVKSFLEEEIINACYASEGNAALHIKDGDDYLSIDFGKQKQSYLVSLAQGKVSEVAFESLSLKA